MSEKVERRPFHETIVDYIECYTDYEEDLAPLGDLLMATKIPKNHDAIIAAWKKTIEGVADENGFLTSVLADIEEQKREAEAKTQCKQETEFRQILADAREDCN